MEFEIFQLPNGIHVVHSQRTDSIIAHLGVIINAGSRDEGPSEHGMAHFTEHCLFKGTKKRKFYHILNRLDSVGGELDAFTSKEDTCIYASFTDQYYSRAAELLSDVLFNATFPEKEVAKERDVIIDEIHSYQDNPYEQIYDDFERLIFRRHPIGRDILGKAKELKQVNRHQVASFKNRYYTTDRMTISSIGNISTDHLKKLLYKHFMDVPAGEMKNPDRKPFLNYQPVKKQVRKRGSQAHLAMGNLAYDGQHPKKDAFFLLNNVFGGPGMNSRLNLNVREKFGFTYHIESHYTTYSDAGLFYIYAGTDRSKIDKTRELILKEMDKLRKKALGPTQLHSAKNQLIGQLAINRENKSNQMLAYGKSLSLYGRIDTVEDIQKRIERINSKDLLAVANEIFEPSQFSELSYI